MVLMFLGMLLLGILCACLCYFTGLTVGRNQGREEPLDVDITQRQIHEFGVVDVHTTPDMRRHFTEAEVLQAAKNSRRVCKKMDELEALERKQERARREREEEERLDSAITKEQCIQDGCSNHHISAQPAPC